MRTILKSTTYYLGWLVAAGLTAGCTSDETRPVASSADNLDARYYPLAVGRYAIYNVEDIRYTLREGVDTSRFQLRERVADAWTGAGGEIIHALERYTRSSEADEWQLDSIWTARKNERAVVVVENNVPYTKLMFPFQDALEWDGNSLNSKPALRYRLTTTDTALRQEIDPQWANQLEQSRTVVQRQLETLVNDSIMTETYAPGIGLLYKKTRIVYYCADDDCIGQQQIVSGRSYRQTLLTYGEE